MGSRRIAVAAFFVLTLAAATKKSRDDKTQKLDFPKDPPMVAVGETSRLVFQVSPLSGTGLLSQQTRAALKAILKANGGTPVVHIRAFVAGSGDLRRVPQIVSEVFSAKRMPQPSVSVVLAGRLPLENAQVEMEAVSVAKRTMNADGLAFVEAQSPDELAERLGNSTPLIITCFVSSIEEASGFASRFGSPVVDIVQTQREPAHAAANCEAVGQGGSVKAARLAFSGTQVAFGADEKAAAIAFQRLDKDLGAASTDILASHVYALSEHFGNVARRVRTTGGPLMVIPVEGLASLDGTFAADAIAAVAATD